MFTQSGWVTRIGRSVPLTHADQIVSGPVGPHQRFGTLSRLIGTTVWTAGDGQSLRQRRPSNAANGTRMPSRRSTATPNVSAGASAAAMAAAPKTAAHTKTVFALTAAEYTAQANGGGSHDHHHAHR